jgi:hypothetical protein
MRAPGPSNVREQLALEEARALKSLDSASGSFGGWTKVVALFLLGLGLSTAGTKAAEVTQGQIRTALRPT